MFRMKIHWCFLGFRGISIAVMLFIVIGCNLTYKVRNQHDTLEETLYFPCGKVTMELVGRGNSKFTFRQRFDLDQLVYVSPDSLSIFYNDGEIILQKAKISDLTNIRGNIEVSSGQIIEVPFRCDPPVFEGDTLWFFAPRYIKCENEIIGLDTIIFSFVNNFRIYGVNTDK